MSKHMANDLTVVVDDHRHWQNIRKGEERPHEKLVVECVGEIIKGARSEVSLCREHRFSFELRLSLW